MRHERLAKGGKGQNETADQLPILSLPVQRFLVERNSQKRKGIAIALFTSGGDRRGMNATVRAFVRYEFSFLLLSIICDGVIFTMLFRFGRCPPSMRPQPPPASFIVSKIDWVFGSEWPPENEKLLKLMQV